MSSCFIQNLRERPLLLFENESISTFPDIPKNETRHLQKLVFILLLNISFQISIIEKLSNIEERRRSGECNQTAIALGHERINVVEFLFRHDKSNPNQNYLIFCEEESCKAIFPRKDSKEKFWFFREEKFSKNASKRESSKK